MLGQAMAAKAKDAQTPTLCSTRVVQRQQELIDHSVDPTAASGLLSTPPDGFEKGRGRRSSTPWRTTWRLWTMQLCGQAAAPRHPRLLQPRPVCLVTFEERRRWCSSQGLMVVLTQSSSSPMKLIRRFGTAKHKCLEFTASKQFSRDPLNLEAGQTRIDLHTCSKSSRRRSEPRSTTIRATSTAPSGTRRYRNLCSPLRQQVAVRVDFTKDAITTRTTTTNKSDASLQRTDAALDEHDWRVTRLRNWEVHGLSCASPLSVWLCVCVCVGRSALARACVCVWGCKQQLHLPLERPLACSISSQQPTAHHPLRRKVRCISWKSRHRAPHRANHHIFRQSSAAHLGHVSHARAFRAACLSASLSLCFLPRLKGTSSSRRGGLRRG